MEMLSEHTLLGWLEGYLLTGPARSVPHLRGLRARHRFDVQPARQVAGHQQEPRAVARPGRLREHPAVVDRLAAGSQRVLAPGSRLHRPRDQQGAVGRAHLPAARRQHAAVGRRSLPAQHGLHQRHRRRQAEAPAVHDDRRGRRRTAPRASGIWSAGEHRRRRGAGRRAGLAAATSRRWKRWPRRRSCASGCRI